MKEIVCHPNQWDALKASVCIRPEQNSIEQKYEGGSQTAAAFCFLKPTVHLHGVCIWYVHSQLAYTTYKCYFCLHGGTNKQTRLLHVCVNYNHFHTETY
jgi:hypothetical protein